MSPRIHPTAIVDKKAEIAKDAEIGPFAIVGPGCVVGAGLRDRGARHPPGESSGSART